jgi:hypothetical protein
MEPLPYIIGMATAMITWLLLVKPFFGKEKDFMECVMYSLTPDFISWLDNDLQRDYTKSFKLSCFFILVLGAGIIAWLVSDYFIT